jgi:hypothetical protein
MSDLKIYNVVRPYCKPSGFNVLAESKKEAVKLSHKEYGFCSNTKAFLVKMKKGILSSGSSYKYL